MNPSEEEVRKLNSMKLRFLIMGSVITVLSLVLYNVRRHSVGSSGTFHNPALLGLLGVGIVLLILGLLWKSK